MPKRDTEYFHSFYFLSGKVFGVSIIFFFHFLVTILWMIGYKTRLTGVLVWLFMVSLQARNPFVLNSGDLYMRTVLFWCLFLPMGRRYSVDQMLSEWREDSFEQNMIINPNLSLSHPFKKIKEGENQFFNASTFSLLFQIFFLYFFSVFLKNGDAWVKTLEATRYALHSYLLFSIFFLISNNFFFFSRKFKRKYFQKPMAKLMIKFPAMLRAMTYLVLKWEFYGAFLLIIPFKHQYLRCLGCFGFFFFHFGLALNMRLGLFFWYASVVVFFFYKK